MVKNLIFMKEVFSLGLFNKKPKKNKLYSLQEAMNFVSENQGYSVVQEDGGYKVIPDRIANEHINRYRSQLRQRDAFTRGLQTGYAPTQNVHIESSNYRHRYGYHEEER